MPMPHQDMKRLIQRRLRGTEGHARTRVIQECMEMLPGYKQGPYADLRKWLLAQMETTRKRTGVKHSDGLFVPRGGDARIVLLGPPNAGKSSLLRALCGSSVTVGDYPFTTLRPIAATAIINDARIQLVEIPGLIQGAREDKGSGRMYLAAAEDARGFLLVLPLEAGGLDRLLSVVSEVDFIIQVRPLLVVATKADLPESRETLLSARARLPERTLVAVSSQTGEGLEELRQSIWKLAGLMRVFSKQVNPGGRDDRPFIVPEGTTVEELAAFIHKDLPLQMHNAAVWGSSAKFPGQLVGREHILQDRDRVIVKRKA
jgi:small GTP-binding protein